MKKIGIVGTGWRTEFFIRIAKELPDKFLITSVVSRDEEKGQAFSIKNNVRVVYSLEEMLEDNIDFCIVSVKAGFHLPIVEQLFMRKIPVLLETPAAINFEDLINIWNIRQHYRGKIQVLEQYAYQPLYSALLNAVQKGVVGKIQNITLSSLHGYHSVSIMRKFLGILNEDVVIHGKRHEFKVTKTDSREGFVYSGEVVSDIRELVTLEFENGKTGFHDFSSTQYHSTIRSRNICIQGTRGEIHNTTFRYLTKENRPVKIDLNRIDLGVYDNSHWSHHKIMLGDKVLYENPFPHARLNDDEIAIATCMEKMGQYIKTNKGFYTLAEALQDTYLSLLMNESCTTSQGLCSKKQPWT